MREFWRELGHDLGCAIAIIGFCLAALAVGGTVKLLYMMFP